MNFNKDDLQLAAAVGKLMLARQHKVVTAESCTGGLVSALITEIAGSSEWFDRGFVTYSNLSKHQMLNISTQDLLKHGAVSQQIAAMMAEQALVNCHANAAVSITGIAGPGGGSDAKPVGSVWFGWRFSDHEGQHTHTEYQHFSGSRNSIRMQSVRFALSGIINHYRE
ncbi:MAG TPA: CinA family protein [Crenotrichaceae bacterium]|nr:CinA family protein [Crenotrichaceae bacterium]